MSEHTKCDDDRSVPSDRTTEAHARETAELQAALDALRSTGVYRPVLFVLADAL